jgi:type VII secretion protein EccB
MASTPTSKEQVQAYRFVLRRMQSALVRRDAVMLNDPMRTHSRATAVGVLLGIIGLVGFLIYGFFSPQPVVDGNTQIAISKETGQVYVVAKNPDRLVPMTNLASARLLLFGQQTPDKAAGATGQGGGDAAAGAPVNAQVAGGEPKLVSEAALSKMAKDRYTGILDGPDMLPGADRRIGAEWSVCDQLILDNSLADQAAKGEVETTVIAGSSSPATTLSGNSALLVQASDDPSKAYLIYVRPPNSQITSAGAVRAAVDLTDNRVTVALNLDGRTPRAVSSGLLNAIPEVSPLKAPTIAGQGTAVNYVQGENLSIGQVVEVRRTGAEPEFYVVLDGGLQRIPKAVGDLIRFAFAGGEEPDVIDPARITGKLDPKTPISIEDYPENVPQVLDPNANNAVTCLGWKAENANADNRSERTQVTIGASLPVPQTTVAVRINQAGATGDVVDKFVMESGKAAVVRASTSAQDFGSGPIQLITGRGVKYGVPDVETAGALGLGAGPFTPAPNAILRLLPDGPQLNRNDAQRSYDSVVDGSSAGLLPEQAQKQGG